MTFSVKLGYTMDRYRRMAILATVVEHGSIRRAARELRLTPSAVSQQIRRLEEETGVTLLRRSTRRLTVTEAGEAFYEGCAAMVAAAKSAHESLTALQESPIGELSISAPAGFAATHLIEAIAPLLTAHPALSLRVVVTDDGVDVIGDRIDVAITIGTPLTGSTLVRRHLADWPLVLCASPRYLLHRGTPASPLDLAQHDLLALPRWHHGTDVMTGPEGRQHRVDVAPRVLSNNQVAIRDLTLAGMGLSFHVAPEVAVHLATGQLVRVLPDWSLPPVSVAALMPSRNRQPPKVRVAIDALHAHLNPKTLVEPTKRPVRKKGSSTR